MIVRVTDPTRGETVDLDVSADRGRFLLANIDFCMRALALNPGEKIVIECMGEKE